MLCSRYFPTGGVGGDKYLDSFDFRSGGGEKENASWVFCLQGGKDQYVVEIDKHAKQPMESRTFKILVDLPCPHQLTK